MSVFISIIVIINILVIIYFVLINGMYLFLVISSFFHIRRYRNIDRIFQMTGVYSTKLYKPVSIIAPAYNEEESVINSVNSLLNLKYANFEVIVVNDGSKDETLQRLIDYFKLVPDDRHRPKFVENKPIKAVFSSERYPKLLVVDKENGGKADALNAGINMAKNELICSVDADSVLETDVILKMLRVFMEDENTIAVGGVVRVANGCTFKNRQLAEVGLPKSYFGRIQAVEYLRAFLFGRVGWDYLNALLIISGAFGVFDRRAVIRVGGYVHDTVGEDMELVLRLHDHYIKENIPYKIRFISDPVCWTEVPEDYKTLARQRNRWQRGLADSLWRYKHMTLNPKYGKLGTVAMPFFIVGELLAPIIELSGYILVIVSWMFGIVNTTFALVFFFVAVVLGMILSLSAVLLEELTVRRYSKGRDVLKLALYALLENLGYRQLHVWWRLRGIIAYLKGDKEWGEMKREGIAKEKAA
ncbi:MAG: glycosyltransferase [Balneolia bacterium]|nr:glycosyltransferase [Balneolia bacterium]